MQYRENSLIWENYFLDGSNNRREVSRDVVGLGGEQRVLVAISGGGVLCDASLAPATFLLDGVFTLLKASTGLRKRSLKRIKSIETSECSGWNPNELRYTSFRRTLQIAL